MSCDGDDHLYGLGRKGLRQFLNDRNTSDLTIGVGSARFYVHRALFQHVDYIRAFCDRWNGGDQDQPLMIDPHDLWDAYVSAYSEVVPLYVHIYYGDVDEDAVQTHASRLITLADYLGDAQMVKAVWLSHYERTNSVRGLNTHALYSIKYVMGEHPAIQKACPDGKNIASRIRLEHLYVSEYTPHMDHANTPDSFVFPICHVPPVGPYLTSVMDNARWTIPPPPRTARASWVNDQHTFLTRLGWATNGLMGGDNPLIELTENMFVSGSILPLCNLQFVYPIVTRTSFMEYVREVYNTLDIDIYFRGAQGILDRESFVTGLRVRFPNLKISKNEHGQARIQLTPDADEYPCLKLNQCAYEFIFDVVARHHFPWVRAWFGQDYRVFVTAQCLVSWHARACTDDMSVYFLPRAEQEHKDRLVLKWAIRGFGFTRKVFERNSITLPRAVEQWLHPYVEQGYNLPWYHPLYNPSIWPKRISQKTIDDFKICE